MTTNNCVTLNITHSLQERMCVNAGKPCRVAERTQAEDLAEDGDIEVPGWLIRKAMGRLVGGNLYQCIERFPKLFGRK